MANLSLLEEAYASYQKNPGALDPSWRAFFALFEEPKGKAVLLGGGGAAESLFGLAEAYRRCGHLGASINPLDPSVPPLPPSLELERWGLQEEGNCRQYPSLGLLPEAQAPLTAIVSALKKRYCGSVGIEFKDFLAHPGVEEWIQRRIESGGLDEPFDVEEKRAILEALTRAEGFEAFLHTKHVGKKRFSLEGAESLIPMLKALVAAAPLSGVQEILIGMPHRGRLNVFANILHKPLASIFREFEGHYEPVPFEGMGDIPYHRGCFNESLPAGEGRTLRVSVAPNPSHLESIYPVVEGQAHARQFLVGDEAERTKVLPLLLHGDAALAGQGSVYETLQMSRLPGFQTGGTLHVVVNNQIGFTTSPREGRSTLYCTDIARTFGAPVFHLNADDPEACVRALLMALEIRQIFHCDVFLDLNAYRRHGHNEGDEPSYTQPLDYRLIREKKSVRMLYLEKLLAEGTLDREAAGADERNWKETLKGAYLEARKESQRAKRDAVEEGKRSQTGRTGVGAELLGRIAAGFSRIPEGFHLHPKLQPLIEKRARSVQEGGAVDWGTAEFLAYGSLVWEGIPVRVAGQDSGRGTFSHRHAFWVDQVDGRRHFPLASLREGQARFEVLNTCLSEAAALGFEYGYSLACQEGLTIWEAQFGDFANSAQVMIDQYLASGEQKWGQRSGLVLFLPHGFEGQGSDHSSARLERFLALAGHDNVQIANPTTPAQFFHLLRRQVKQPIRKPLIVLTPKGLLRHPACTSPLSDFAQHSFRPFLDDPGGPRSVRRIALCSGRIYYDLQGRRTQEDEGTAILRVEQLYPLDEGELKRIMESYRNFEECLWVQDEPENMGAWPFMFPRLSRLLPRHVLLTYAGRKQSATPATGFYARHQEELAAILSQVFPR